MTQDEREYYEKLVEFDAIPEIQKALRLSNTDEDGVVDLDEIYEIFNDINNKIDSDILDSRQNLIVSYNIIDGLKHNLMEMVRLQEAEEDEEEKAKFDSIISNAIHSCDAMFNQIQDIVQDIDVAQDTKRYMEEIKRKF